MKRASAVTRRFVLMSKSSPPEKNGRRPLGWSLICSASSSTIDMSLSTNPRR